MQKSRGFDPNLREQLYKIGQNAKPDKKDRQYEEGLRYIHDFSSRDRNMHLVPQESIALFQDIEKKLKNYHEKERAHNHEMNQKNEELKRNRKMVYELEEKYTLRERQICQKILQINQVILHVPLKHSKHQLVDSNLNFNDLVEAIIRNASNVVEQFDKVKGQQKLIKVQVSPQFNNFGGFDESAISMDSFDDFEASIDFDNGPHEYVEGKIKKLISEKKVLNQHLQRISLKYREQQLILEDLKQYKIKHQQDVKFLENMVNEQITKIQTMENLLEEANRRQKEERSTLSYSDILKNNKTNSSNQDNSIEGRSSHEVIESLMEQNIKLEKKMQSLEQYIRELKEEHQKAKRNTQILAEKLLIFDDTGQQELIAENKRLTTKMVELTRQNEELANKIKSSADN